MAFGPFTGPDMGTLALPSNVTSFLIEVAIDHSQDPEPTPGGQGILPEIHRPHRVGSLQLANWRRIPRQPLTLEPAHRLVFQSIPAIEPFMVQGEAMAFQQDLRSSITEARFLLGQGD